MPPPAREAADHQTTSFVFDSADHARRSSTCRPSATSTRGCRTRRWRRWRNAGRALENGRAAVALGQRHGGQAVALMTLLQQGDHVVAAGALYGGSGDHAGREPEEVRCRNDVRRRRDPRRSPPRDPGRTRAPSSPSLGNPSLVVLDIAAVAEVAHAHGIPLVIDNTVPSPFLPADRHGADIVVHSATKYLGGHGTTLAGDRGRGKFPWDNGKFPGMTEPSPGYHGVSSTRPSATSASRCARAWRRCASTARHSRRPAPGRSCRASRPCRCAWSATAPTPCGGEHLRSTRG